MNNPLDIFFKLGEKVTRGDPNRQADFVYYMVWIIFLAFFLMFVSNAYRLFVYRDISYATWTLVGFAICGIQYFSLKGMYDMKKMRKQLVTKEEPIDNIDAMLKQFKNDKEVDKNAIRKTTSSRSSKSRSS